MLELEKYLQLIMEAYQEELKTLLPIIYLDELLYSIFY